jgi:CrcB protein
MNPTVFLVAVVAGGLGATLRYVSTAVFAPKNSFPLGVLLSNLVGSFLAGVAAALLTDSLLSPEMAFILVVGFCGGLTTMSSFAVDTVTAMTAGKWKGAALNISVTTIGSVLLAGVGYILGITLSF